MFEVEQCLINVPNNISLTWVQFGSYFDNSDERLAYICLKGKKVL